MGVVPKIEYGLHHTKAKFGAVLKTHWKNKAMHEQYIRNIDRLLISEEDKFLWLTKGGPKSRN
jgi:hypothetical protein